jgi:16S rRNA G1207 methylase RsmC
MPAVDIFHAFGRDYSLQRYPLSNDVSLRAWDAADEYLLNSLQDQAIELSQVCVIHDHFGALTLPLAGYNPLCYGDSWLSKEALLRNLRLNSLNNDIRFAQLPEEFTAYSNHARYIIGRIPKSKRQLASLLSQLNHWAHEGTTMLLAGMDKHLSRGQFDLLGRYFGPARFYPGVKKARIWEAKVDKSLSNPDMPASTLSLNEFSLSLTAGPNVFSQDKLDIGTRFFLDHLNKLPEAACVADLACGNGIIGLAYLRRHPNSHVSFVDESFQAIQSTQHNILTNFPQARTLVQAGDGLKAFSPDQFDLILCNPPFHLQNTVSTEIAQGLFKDAYRCLKPSGALWIVANRHLGYHQILRSLFKNVCVQASNPKFVILSADKP